MTDTNQTDLQPTDAQTADSSAAEDAQQPEQQQAQADTQPFDQHPAWIKMREKQQETLAAREKEIQELRQRLETQQTGQGGLSAQDLQKAIREALDKELAPVRETVQRESYKRELGVPLSEAQLEALNKIKSELPDLSVQRAYALAKTENPDLFGGRAAGFDPAVHQSTIPNSGASPVRVPLPEDNPIGKLPKGATNYERRQAMKSWLSKNQNVRNVVAPLDNQ